MASSKSTRWPSKSGPSTQANFVSPPTLRRQPPHIPVPSIMMGFMLTTVLIPYSFVRRATNFIMIRGPMAMTSSYASPASIRRFKASVTSPFSPAVPSSLVRTKRSETARNSFSRMTRSLLRNPTIEWTVHPSEESFFATGYAMAHPTPPPTTATFFRPSVSVGRPSGPTKSSIISPSRFPASFMVVFPTVWKMMVTLPRSGSVSATVRGIRSPNSSTRRMINWPACAFLATGGDSISIRITCEFNSSRFRIL